MNQQELLMSTLLLSPFLGFIFNGLRTRQNSALLAGWVATFAAVTSFVSSLMLVLELISNHESVKQISVTFFNWIQIGTFSVDAAFVVDSISAIMILVVTGVGSLIHLFSIGYMAHDKGAARYFSYLNLFLFNMLLLVLGSNLLVMFVGWEGVGLCSYLLIGFWFTDKEKSAAGMKAFITNRIGDAAFLFGIFILFFSFGTLSFSELTAFLPKDPVTAWLSPITLSTLFLFIGATGKSAQIPLYVWLPDAMAGPTPVSALIHAATMVTAGVYMIVRLSALFILAPNTMLIIATIGACTVIMAALIGLAQWDIKKVLAYSTVSQLGYMFLACGVGAFGAAMFHLMTHAFFKALMFLGSGSVIHAMHEEQDIRKMGGLKKYLPITHITFFIGWLAIIGIPPFAGFFSKDEILWMSFHSPMGNLFLWIAGAFGALLTAFYMTRLMALTFWGKSRVPPHVHPHESPWTMTVPLVALAMLSFVGGWIGIPSVIGEILPGQPLNILENWFHGSLAVIPNLQHGDSQLEWSLMGISVLLASVSAATAFHFYVNSPKTPERLAAKAGSLYQLIANKFYVDEIYNKFIISPLIRFSQFLWYRVDVGVVDKTTYLVSDLVKGVGLWVRQMQNGNLQQYALYISLGVVIMISYIFMR